MQTRIAEFVKSQPEAGELQGILRSCVHCGFCNATCPTYQLTGDELDGPRGRIYLLKQMLEGESVSDVTHKHLDRCLSCRSCETTCPSGVRYSRLFDVGKQILAKRKGNRLAIRLKKMLMRIAFSKPKRFALLIKAASQLRPFLPRPIQVKIPEPTRVCKPWPAPQHHRQMLILNHCVQGALAPAIDEQVAAILDKLSISLIPVNTSTCCGALNYHLSGYQQAVIQAKQNIDACWPLLEQGAEAIVSTASGCGLMLKEYRELLQYDPEYAEKAARFSSMTQDISEVLVKEDLSQFKIGTKKTIAFQSPCTLQHGQQLHGQVEALLNDLGFQLQAIENSHLCCGSAGVYSLLQPEMANQLRDDKLAALSKKPVACIVTANIGCLMHLKTASQIPVMHWVELL